jgi:integrase
MARTSSATLAKLPSRTAVDKLNVCQKKTGEPVRFEMRRRSEKPSKNYNRAANKTEPVSLRRPWRPGSTDHDGQYARLVSQWTASIGLDPSFFGTHSLRRTKATLIYRRTGNVRAIQPLLGHRKIESTVR